MLRLSIISFAFTTSVAVAQSCPPLEDQSERLDALIAGANAAQTEMAGREFSAEMWAIWRAAPDDAAQEMLDTGLMRLAEANFAAATASFDQLIAYCPDYAEGYNQRAFASFLQSDYGPALEDLDRALERSPKHVAALAGKALTLMKLGRTEVSQSVLRDALALNPWLSERALLIEAPGEDI